MRKPGWVMLSALLVSVAGSTAGAQAAEFVANLTPDQEVTPPTFTFSDGSVRPMSFGWATLSLSPDRTALTMMATIHNIDVTGTQTDDTNDNLGAAHIHAPAPPGVNAGVVWGFFGAPDNDDMPDDLVVTPFATGVGGTFVSVWNLPEGNAGTTLAAQLPNLLGGQAYLNFHTMENPGGEIRGQIAVVPEPATVLLLGSGLAGLALVARRRRE